MAKTPAKNSPMKRKAPPARSGASYQDIKRDFTTEQLAGIGAICMAFNEVEFLLDTQLYSGLNLPGGIWVDIVTRINGIDGKIALVRKAAHDACFPDAAANIVKETLDEVGLYKTYRDAIIHARIFDRGSAIGQIIRKRGRIEQVLLSEEALKGLYDRLVILRKEMLAVLALFDLIRYVKITVRERLLDESISQHEPEFRGYVARLQEHQSQRQSLPPLPKFPD